MNIEENKALIRDWLQLADAGFSGDFDRFFAPNYVGHVSGRIHQTLAELKVQERAAAQVFSKATRTVEDLLAVEDKVVLRLSIKATHTGTFQGVPATGRDVVFTGIVIYRIAERRIAESWGEIDFAGLRQQLTAPAST